jgi:hypothetical protein
MAADAMPAVSFEGWVDTILALSTDDHEDDLGGTEKDEEGAELRFTAQASLKANWKVTDALSARVNLWFNAGNGISGTNDANDDVTGTSNLNMREAYFAWAINDTVTWSMGKYIDHIGWLSAEPTGLYTVNASLIGYTETYGNDVIGTSIAVAPKDSPISGSFHITNGYYTSSDALNGPSNASREGTDLGFGLDLIYVLPNEKGSINLEFAYDMASDNNGAAGGDLGGDVLLVGGNATLTLVKPLLLGVEVQYLTFDESDPAANAPAVDRLQGLFLANYAIEGASIPMSVSGMIQFIQSDTDGAAEKETELGLTAALLTNPLTSSNFGLNFEVGFWDITAEGGVDGEDYSGIVVAVEGLVTF